MTNPRVCLHKSRFRTAPLKLSNPFLRKERKAAYEETFDVVSKMFPDASVDWVRRHAWAKARSVVALPKKQRRARA